MSAESTAESNSAEDNVAGEPAGSDVVRIFDTTLRDGEQSPGCSMNTAEKLEVAKALVDLGVDVIEAGFPIASPGDFEAVQKIAQKFGDQTTICGLARCRPEDIDRAAEAVRDAELKRIHVFLATSAIHREFKLKMDKDEIVRRAVEGVQRAKESCEDIEFSPEDAARTELDFLCEVVEKAIDAGATTVNIPDTVGYATPAQYRQVIETLRQRVPNIERAIISTHCHNDLGLAVANSLAAVEAGARQIECTVNGIGERAGNAALEEIVMAIRTRFDHYGVRTNIDTPKLCSISRLVCTVTGQSVQRNKAIVGRNAFAHEAGIHQHGILQERSTYEIMRAEDVGYVGTNLVLGKHSGRHAFRDRVAALGHSLDPGAFEQVFADFITLADKKKEVYDSDIVALIEDRIGVVEERWQVVSFHTSAGSGSIPTATIELKDADGEIHCDAATGDGPIDAVFNTLERIIGIEARLDSFEVRSVSRGKDALGEVNVRLAALGRDYHGKGVSTDIIEAGMKAYLKALNAADAEKASGRQIAEAAQPARGV
ncbi:2-isopropylmalate synthase [Stratiformator vulcanicus]|uniref:2-isopropylmalate synthase n=1 Tax=Stratiformator vulcanicus TaxID=2527980 RepID=A0A517QYP3_9PLAN|nr:2-isopropylmalate synthase [Stratiformator vulcanicus]QDT36718.1 2-isopropylmalate synthase [Stratiformator vulcanicus]